MKCNICPRRCKSERDTDKGAGFCGMGNLPVLAKACLHYWEEPCISGTRGSGTVFFSGCTLKCVFCQNYVISQQNFGRKITVEQLADVFINLQEKGAHNINLVNPSHFAAAVREAVILSRKKGLSIPVVFNTHGYDSHELLSLMKGIVDIYLPDLKYFSAEISQKYSGASDYFEVASEAIREMYSQTGPAVLGSDGMMKKGIIVRHMILPGYASDSVKVLEWLRSNMPEDIFVSVMSQYTPYNRECLSPELDRHITRREYEKVLDKFCKLGFENGFMQERSSADEIYIPEFNLEGVPF
jgi:putative pyruvate formate lyase activating enzyme